MNLETYIERKWDPILAEKVPYLVNDQLPRMRTAQIWEIMKDIACGVAFIHHNREIHRDLKPRNG